jgi:hypothetical protein
MNAGIPHQVVFLDETWVFANGRVQNFGWWHLSVS